MLVLYYHSEKIVHYHQIQTRLLFQIQPLLLWLTNIFTAVYQSIGSIISNLKNLLPLYQTYYNSIDVYAWNDKVSDPYPGIDGGAYISVNNNDDNQKLFVIEISNNEVL